MFRQKIFQVHERRGHFLETRNSFLLIYEMLLKLIKNTEFTSFVKSVVIYNLNISGLFILLRNIAHTIVISYSERKFEIFARQHIVPIHPVLHVADLLRKLYRLIFFLDCVPILRSLQDWIGCLYNKSDEKQISKQNGCSDITVRNERHKVSPISAFHAIGKDKRLV